MKFRLVAATLILTCLQWVAGPAFADAGIRQEKVQFAKGASSAVIKGQLKGDATVDYVVRAAAGQTLSVRLQETNAQNYFNVMPPASKGSSMIVGTHGQCQQGVPPSAGAYV